jgi:hypothetical protein
LTKHSAEITKAYLSAILFINHLAGEYPLLDLRVHLFLRDIGGYLKRCIKCHKYHSGRQEYCQDCGFPLFLVYRSNINQCIGKISGNRLKWELRPESDDKRNSFYVLISLDAPPEGEALSFRDDGRVSKEEIILDYEEYGRLKLTLLPMSVKTTSIYMAWSVNCWLIKSPANASCSALWIIGRRLLSMALCCKMNLPTISLTHI